MELDWKKYFDFIFPPSEDEVMVRNCSALKYTPGQHESVTFLSSFKNPEVRAAVHLVKFHNHHKSKILLANLLKEYLSQTTNKLMIIPMPLSNQRLRQRGYNQVTEVIKIAQKNNSNLNLNENILKRAKNTAPQSGLERDERLINMKGVFTVTKNLTPFAGTVIILDDVVTTGATMRAAKAALSPHTKQPIKCVALSH